MNELADKFSPRIGASIRRRSVDWLAANRRHVESMADREELQGIPDLIGEILSSHSPARIRLSVSVVIPCCNLSQYLEECLSSVLASTIDLARVIVVNDSGTDQDREDSEEIAGAYGVEFHQVEFKDVHRVRQFGLSLLSITEGCVLFLDADNKIEPDYLEHCRETLIDNPDAAFCFPPLIAFDGASGPWYNTDKAPEIVRAEDVERINCCDASSVFRVDALRQSRALDIPAPSTIEDWTMVRRVLRSGAWHARKSAIPVNYRVREGQRSQLPTTYAEEACLVTETVTVVVAFSGRFGAWRKLRRWFLQQSWPVSQVRLLIIDSSHKGLSVADLDLEHWRGAGIQIERMDAGVPRLADKDRRRKSTFRSVETAVSSIYNRALQLVPAEWILFVEDDVIPAQRDTISRLFRRVDYNVSCVSGVYAHRYEVGAVAFRKFAEDGSTLLLPMEGPEVEEVVGTGFGCLLARRSVLRNYALSGATGQQPHYDVSVARRMKADGFRWILDRSVFCDHLTQERNQ